MIWIVGIAFYVIGVFLAIAFIHGASIKDNESKGEK